MSIFHLIQCSRLRVEPSAVGFRCHHQLRRGSLLHPYCPLSFALGLFAMKGPKLGWLGLTRGSPRANTVELTVRSWEAVGYFALSPCGRAWFKSWVFQVTVRTVPVPQPGTLGVGSGASDEPVQADAGTRRPGPEAGPSRSRPADIAGRRLARPH